ncbi:DNA primase small subunit, partial [Fragariocoptes setiger]
MSDSHLMNLETYYRDHFPHKLLFDWLNYKDGNHRELVNREFSFTLSGDIYIRFLSFRAAEEFKRELIRKIPLKIDIGAVYNMPPNEVKKFGSLAPNFKPREHELVFDIDISDYDDVRNCCTGSDICKKCWPFMKVGARILHKILTEEFGFQHLLFVFSGRRGFHCWVCDKRARVLSSRARSAIASYLSIIDGGQAMVKRVNLNPRDRTLHPMLRKALEIIDSEFEDLMIEKQDFLGSPNLLQNVIDLCPEKYTRDEMIKYLKPIRAPSQKMWQDIIKTVNKMKSKRQNFSQIEYYIEEVKLQHCYPRLDVNVTKGLNHLLKIPFCIHPKTGKVCVPFDIEQIDEFDPFEVPTLPELASVSNEAACKKLDQSFQVMRRFVNKLSKAQPLHSKVNLDF